MSTAELHEAQQGPHAGQLTGLPERRLQTGEAAVVFERALRARARGDAIGSCSIWSRLERAARASGERHLAVQAAAERSLTLTWMGALSVAGSLCEQLLAELSELERDGRAAAAPPLDADVVNRFGGVWFSVAGLHRLRAEQLRRAGDYVGALDHLELASTRADQPPDRALPLWGRVIQSESLRLAGDFEGAYEVGMSAAWRARRTGTHPWVRVFAERSAARALLALGRSADAHARFAAMARSPAHRNADGRIACDLGSGEALRRRGEQSRAATHLRRASADALRIGHVVAWIHAQLGLAELARARGDRREAGALAGAVHDRLLLVEHPFLRMRAFAIGALCAAGERAERLVDRAEEELPRFRRRSCDVELERALLERCRIAVAAGEQPGPLALDLL